MNWEKIDDNTWQSGYYFLTLHKHYLELCDSSGDHNLTYRIPIKLLEEILKGDSAKATPLRACPLPTIDFSFVET